MNHVERFRALMDFQEVDRVPRWEWAMWWDKTIERWHGEGLSADLTDIFDIHEYFGLDPYKQYWFSTTESTIEAAQHHVEGVVSNMDDYLNHKQYLYPDHSKAIEGMKPWLVRQEQGDVIIWITLEGFFWFPRTMMGFTKLMMAFYDQPELLHKINEDLLEFNLELLDQIAKIGKPVFMTIAEDMSYNNGPMISREHMDELDMAGYPYPRPIIGSQYEEETWLAPDAWIIQNEKGSHTWNQSHVRSGVNNSGFWPVEMAADGTYQFDVRRWPKELDHPISASLPSAENGDIDSQGRTVQPGKGKAIPAERVELVVGTTKLEKTIGDSDASARFDVKSHAGSTDVRAWLIDAKGNKRGAYYIYVKRMSR